MQKEPCKATDFILNPDEGSTHSEVLADTKFPVADLSKKLSNSLISTEDRTDDCSQRNEKDFKQCCEGNETIIILDEKSNDWISSVDEETQDGHSCFEEPKENNASIIKPESHDLPNASQLEFSHTINGTGPQMLGCYDQSYTSYTSPWILREDALQPIQYHSAPLPQGYIRPQVLHPSQIVYPHAINFHGNHFVPHGLLTGPSQVPVFEQSETSILFSSTVAHSDHKSPCYRHEIRHDTYRIPQRSPNTTLTSNVELGSSVDRTILTNKGTNIREHSLSDDGKYTLEKQLKETRQEKTNKGHSFLSCSLQSVEKSHLRVSNGAPKIPGSSCSFDFCIDKTSASSSKLGHTKNGGRAENAGDLVDKFLRDEKVVSETGHKQESLCSVTCSSTTISERMHFSDSKRMAVKNGYLTNTSLDLDFVEQAVPDENKKVLANPSSTVSCDRKVWNSVDKNIRDSERWLSRNPSDNTSKPRKKSRPFLIQSLKQPKRLPKNPAGMKRLVGSNTMVNSDK